MFFFVRTQNDVNSLNREVTNTLGVASGILSTQLSGKANLGLESPTAVCPEAYCTLISGLTVSLTFLLSLTHSLSASIVLCQCRLLLQLAYLETQDVTVGRELP